MLPRYLALILMLVVPLSGQACSIPVFRYALERWSPARYDALLVQRGPLSTELANVPRSFEQEPGTANLSMQFLDLASAENSAGKRYNTLHGSRQPLPCLLVRFPETNLEVAPAWAGAASPAGLKALLHSPLRTDLVKRLTSGASAVFLLLQSGNDEADRAAEVMLRRELAAQERLIELSDRARDETQLLYKVPLRISFPVVTLSRSVPEEQALIALLLHGDEDLTGVKGPIAFPIFGRGRVMGSFHGDQLGAEQIQRVTRYLCGDCSCEVKKENPGFDLLIAAPWQDLLAAWGEAGSSVVVPPAPSALTAPTPTPLTTVKEGQPSPRWLQPAIALAGVVVILTGLWVWRGQQTRPDNS
jgi:hypothetical protein